MGTVRQNFSGSNEEILQIARWVKRQIARESQFVPDLQTGDFQGLMQIGMPAINHMKQQSLLSPNAVINRLDAEQNISTGVLYLSWLRAFVAEYPTNRVPSKEDLWKFAMASYNAGYGAIINARGRATDPSSWATVEPFTVGETQIYIRSIFSPWETNPAE